MVASLESDQSLDSNLVTGALPPNPDLGAGGGDGGATKTITVEVTAQDSKGNIAVTVFKIDLGPGVGKHGWNMEWPGQRFGLEHHAGLPMISPELAAIEAAVRDVTHRSEPFGHRAAPVRQGNALSGGESPASGRAGLTEQLASIGWRSLDAQRNALLASVRQRQ
jgi:hypothetical protein